MRITVNHEDLAPALIAVARAVPTRAVRPVLGAVLFTAADGHLTLAATDLHTSIVTSAPANIELEGRACLPARYLTDLMRRIPGGTVEIAAEPDSGGARIAWAQSQFTIHGFAADDFPAVSPFPSSPHHTFPQRLLREAIGHTAFAAAQGDTARALLTGVELRLGADALFALATDGFQAAVYASKPGAPRPESGAVVVPAAVLQEMARVLGDVDDPCDVAVEGHQIMFRCATTLVVARILEGRYFAVLDLVPRAFPTQIRIDREALVGALERMAIIVEAEAPHCVMLDAALEGLRVSANRAEVGSAEEHVEASVSGAAVHLGFNVRQTIEGLRRFAGREVLLEISGPKSLSRWSDPEDPRFQHMQMPLELQA